MQRNDEGLVYRGREDRVHIADGQRAEMGRILAHSLMEGMRVAAYRRDENIWNDNGGFLPACPGCYMTALFNAAVTLAKANGQSLTELGNTLAGEFSRLAAGGPDRIESVHVVLDCER